MIGLEISTETGMEVEQSRAVNPAMTFDEVSMERSKNFVKALQVLHPLSLSLSLSESDLSFCCQFDQFYCVWHSLWLDFLCNLFIYIHTYIEGFFTVCLANKDKTKRG